METGLVIVGGVTVAYLRLGLADAKDTLSGYPKASKIATFTMGAEHLLYFSGLDLSAALSAKLDGSVQDFSDLSSSTKAVLGAYASLGRSYDTRCVFRNRCREPESGRIQPQLWPSAGLLFDHDRCGNAHEIAW